MPYHRKFTPEIEKLICEEYLAGASMRSLAKKYSNTHQVNAIQSTLERNKIYKKKLD